MEWRLMPIYPSGSVSAQAVTLTLAWALSRDMKNISEAKMLEQLNKFKGLLT
jgi:hypothetical protein